MFYSMAFIDRMGEKEKSSIVLTEALTFWNTTASRSINRIVQRRDEKGDGMSVRIDESGLLTECAGCCIEP
jgi:hypothetical protein